MNQPIEENLQKNLEINKDQIVPGQDHWLNLVGFIRTLNEVPTYTPRMVSQQFVLVTNGGSSRVYIYDTYSRLWKYTTLI